MISVQNLAKAAYSYKFRPRKSVITRPEVIRAAISQMTFEIFEKTEMADRED